MVDRPYPKFKEHHSRWKGPQKANQQRGYKGAGVRVKELQDTIKLVLDSLTTDSRYEMYESRPKVVCSDNTQDRFVITAVSISGDDLILHIEREF